MPFIKLNGASIYYEDTGSGPETIVFSHGLLLSSLMFRDQVTEFKSRYRCIACDGHHIPGFI